MSGHSKWSTIKRQKGAADVKRGMTFTKIANAITLAAKLGSSGDPGVNPRLRMVLESAKQANLPKENVQRAIDKGLGKLPGQTIEEVIFEGFGPAKAAFLVETITDNKMRTLAEMRNIFERSGGSLGSQGSTAYMFDNIGEIKVSSKGGLIEDEMLQLIDLGAEDLEDFTEDNSPKYLIYTKGSELNTMGNKITQLGFNIEESAVSLKPNVSIDISDKESAEKVLVFAEKLESHDDVHKVHSNFNIADDLI